MKKIQTSIHGVFLIELQKFEDRRGCFIETWNDKDFGLPNFVQDNQSFSKKGVLRGLHYQIKEKSQGKLVRCTNGSVYDVVVDLRTFSPTFSRWYGIYLDRPELLLWIPPGLAHGFYTTSNEAEFHYKATNYYEPSFESILLWNDKDLRISWPLDQVPIISGKDISKAKTFLECPKFDSI